MFLLHGLESDLNNTCSRGIHEENTAAASSPQGNRADSVCVGGGGGVCESGVRGLGNK